MSRFSKRWVNRERLTHGQMNELARIADLGAGDIAMPEDYGAIGDGVSRRAGTYLGLANLAALQAYQDGIYSFAQSLDTEIDELGLQAMIYDPRPNKRLREGAHYLINRGLHNRNAHIREVDCRNATIDATAMSAEAPGEENLVTNGDFATGTGWTNTSLDPHADWTFGGGAAEFTDPYTPGNPSSFGQFGQQVTLTEGKWTVRATLSIAEGASLGKLGRRYIGFGFFPDGVGLGGYATNHALYRSTTLYDHGSEALTLDVEVPEGETYTTWLVFTGGNADLTVDDISISAFRVNAAIWGDGTNYGGDLPVVDACWWRNLTLIGPGMNSGVRGILRKSFTSGDKRLNLQDVDVTHFSGGHVFSDQAYLCIVRGGNTGFCNPCVQMLPGSFNAGENMRFSQHIFFNSGLVFDLGGGLFRCTDCSMDFCDKFVEASRGAILTFAGEHFEANPPETFLLYDALSADFTVGATLTGGTSGAVATIVAIDETTGTTGKLTISTTDEFADNETITDGAGGSATANGTVTQGGVLWDLRGGSMVLIDTQDILMSGAGHRGAQHLADVADQTSTLTLPPSAYNLKTASGIFAKGAGRVIFTKGHMGPGNALLPDLIADNFNSDLFMGAGRIYGASTLSDSNFEDEGGPEDAIGLMLALHGEGPGGTRALIPYQGSVARDTGVGPESGFGSIKIEYNGEFHDGSLDFRVFAPVRDNSVVLFQYRWCKPDDLTPPEYGPFTNGSPTAGDTIRVSTADDSKIVEVDDKHCATLGGNGPQAGWTVTLSGVTGNPGGIANATLNATHTVKERTGATTFTIEVATAATSTVADTGGTGIGSAYVQVNALVFFRVFWVSVVGSDATGRPLIGNVNYQGEQNILVPAAAMSAWTTENFGTWYASSEEPEDATLRIGNGRAPAGATHAMMIWNLDGLRFLDPGQKVYLHLGHLKGSRL